MSYIRYQIDLAFKEPVPVHIVARLGALDKELKLLLDNAEIINPGGPDEENTKKIRKHICNHDIHQPCEDVIVM